MSPHKLPEKEIEHRRNTLPYGKWIRADGTQCFFNRDYKPIWCRTPSGEVERTTSFPPAEGDKTEYLYSNDGESPLVGRPPRVREATKERCIAALKEWGIIWS